MNTETKRFNVEPYTEYLKLLARLQLPSRIQGKLDASDIAQQTILHAHANRDQFRGGSEEEWVGWLRTILSNTLKRTYRTFGTNGRDIGREQSIHSGLEDSASRVEHWLAAQQSSPSHKASRHEQLILLASALAQLPFDQREAVELHHLKGLTVAEVGKLMGKTRPAAMGLIFRGLKRLREILGEEGF